MNKIFFNIKLLVISAILLVCLITLLIVVVSCGEGVDIGEVNKVLTSFSISWNDEFNGRIKEEVPINIRINALAQDNTEFNWNGTVDIEVTNNFINVAPTTTEISGGTKDLKIIFSIIEGEEDQNTNLIIRYNDISTTVATNITVEKVFEEYELTIDSDGFGITTPSGTITVLHGEETDISDLPDDGFVFNQWIKTGGEGIVSFSDSYSAITKVKLVNGDAAIQATHLTPDISVLYNSKNIPINGSHDIGRVLIDSLEQTVFTIKNDGYGQIILNGDPKVSINGDSEFSISEQPQSPISENTSTSFTLDFLPETINHFACNLLISNNDPDEEEFIFTTTGEGVNKISGSDTTSNDNFGRSLDSYGDYLIVGAPYDDDKGSNSGAAYLFHNDEGKWIQIKKLTASDGDGDDWFGYSVAIYGDFIVIGAPNDEDNGTGSGSAYIYYRNQGGSNNWGQFDKIISSNGSYGDSFGHEVDIWGNYIIIGAPYVGSDVGSAYIFYYNGSSWSQQAILTDSNGSSYDYFGISVSISGDYAVVGAKGDDIETYMNSGSALIFYKDQGGTDNWGLQQKVYPADRATSDNFGSSVSICYDNVAIGAPGKEDEKGKVYVFTRNETFWTQEYGLSADDSESGSKFGDSVKIVDNEIVVGAYQYDENGTDSGKAYYFKKSGSNWNQNNTYIGPDTIGNDYFAFSIDISQDYIFCGAYNNDENGNDSGATYVFVK